MIFCEDISYPPVTHTCLAQVESLLSPPEPENGVVSCPDAVVLGDNASGEVTEVRNKAHLA